MVSEEHALSVLELDAETALELPDRHMLALVVIGGGGLVNVGVAIDQVNVSANVCGVLSSGAVSCTSSAGG